ncbi:MAG TPA: hypothetical protein VFH31_13895 [Pyrinomonadaceae bacterium]|nr:hypothetical protein [Pyrinomonadaceae bacterium]
MGGVMEVGGIDPCWLTFTGTVAASDRVNLQGRHEEHHGVAKLDLHDFGDGAAILDGGLMLHFNDGRMSDGTLLLLRPFAHPPDPIVPNPSGSYRGAFRNAEGTTGEITAQLHPPDPQQPTSFNGQVVIVAFGDRHTFELLGTINALGRRIAIAQSDTGSFWTDALEPFDQGGAVSDQSYWTGRFTLELNDGTIHEATFAMRREN